MELVHYCCVLYMFVVCPAIGLLMVYLTAPDHVNFMSSAYWRNKRRENAMRDAERREHEDYMKEIRERRAREKLRQPTESIEVNTEGSTQLNSDKHSDRQSETTSMPHETIINNKTTTAECSMITDSNTEEMDKSILSVDKSQQTTPRKKVTDQFTNTVRPRTKRCKKRKRYHHAYGVELQPIVVVVVLNENSTDTGRVKTSVDVGSQGDKWTGEEMETEVYSTFNHPTVDVLPQGTVPPFSDQTPKQENDVIPASNSRSSTDMKEASFSSSSGTLYSASTSNSVDPCNEKTTPAGPIDNNSTDLIEFDMAYKRMKEKLAGFSKMVKDM